MSQLLTLSDLCRIFQCHRSTIWRRVNKGVLPLPVTFGHTRCRWKPEDIQKHIDQAKPRS